VMVVAHFHSIQESLEAVGNETSFIHLWNDGWHDFKLYQNQQQAK
jgi:SRSO17 transposase